MGCKFRERGKPSIEFYKGDKPQHYCYGYIDLMTDALLDKCKCCPDHVGHAQEDLENWQRREP